MDHPLWRVMESEFDGNCRRAYMTDWHTRRRIDNGVERIGNGLSDPCARGGGPGPPVRRPVGPCAGTGGSGAGGQGLVGSGLLRFTAPTERLERYERRKQRKNGRQGGAGRADHPGHRRVQYLDLKQYLSWTISRHRKKDSRLFMPRIG